MSILQSWSSPAYLNYIVINDAYDRVYYTVHEIIYFFWLYFWIIRWIEFTKPAEKIRNEPVCCYCDRDLYIDISAGL